MEAPEPARVRQVRVTFLPGARTNWHTHPFGQTLYVMSGVGRVQTVRWPGARDQGRRHGLVSAGREALAWRCARDGDVPHVATQEEQGTGVPLADWMESATDAQYMAKAEE